MELNEIISSGLLEMHVLGLATNQESETVLAWAAQYPAVKDELRSIELSLEKYAFAHAIAPSASIRQSVLYAKGNQPHSNKTQPPAPVVAVSSFWKYAAAAAVILLAGSIYYNVNYYNKYQALSEEKKRTEEQLLSQQRVNDEMKNDLSVVQSRYSEPVALRGLAAAPEAAAKIFWMKNTGEVYIDPSNLPEAPEGKQYQLWGIVDGKPVDGGLIISSKKGNQYRIQKMKVFSNVKVQAFAVTLENAGGNPTPKGEMYVMGQM